MTMKKYKGTNNDLQNNTQKAKIEQHEPYDVVGFFQGMSSFQRSN